MKESEQMLQFKTGDSLGPGVVDFDEGVSEWRTMGHVARARVFFTGRSIRHRINKVVSYFVAWLLKLWVNDP